MRQVILLAAGLVAAALAGRSPDSLYFKAYGENTLFRTDKEGRGLVRDAVSFSWLDNNTGPAMDPTGTYLYEAYQNTLRRHDARTGARTDYTLQSRSYSMSCGTDGEHIYYRGQNSWTFIKATLTGALVSINTTRQYIGVSHGLGVARDTFWIAHGDYTPMTYRGYPLSESNGDSTLYNHGELYVPLSGLGTPGPVAWDGTHFFSACGWAPGVPSPFFRWDAEHNFLDTVLLDIDVRSVMVLVPPTGTEDDAAGTKLKPAVEPASVVRGTILLPSDRGGLLFDANGRSVAELVPGRNDVGRLSPGVYFLKPDGASPPRRVVITR